MKEADGPYGPPMSDRDRRVLSGAMSDAEKKRYDDDYDDSPHNFDTPGTSTSENDDNDQDESN